YTIAGMAVSPHGYVTKGPEGRSVLMRMPQDSWDKLQLAKAAVIAKRTGSNAQVKAMIAEKAAAQFGDEAAEWLTRVPADSALIVQPGLSWMNVSGTSCAVERGEPESPAP
ncbi:MAG: hypothetical protein AAB368_07345, partial [bacterium]